jgi:hypothetical protein
MDYRTASRQQLLAERARLQTAYRRAEQRMGSSNYFQAPGGGAARPNRGSNRAPQNEVDRIAEQLARVEAELKRRDEQAAPAAPPPAAPAVEE